MRRGVRDAVWEMITSGTDAPGADFYGTVRTTTGSFSNAMPLRVRCPSKTFHGAPGARGPSDGRTGPRTGPATHDVFLDTRKKLGSARPLLKIFPREASVGCFSLAWFETDRDYRRGHRDPENHCAIKSLCHTCLVSCRQAGLSGARSPIGCLHWAGALGRCGR